MSVRKCCSASISVGAMKALVKPHFHTYHMSAAATSVLPLPTSPCKSRFMTRPERMSLIACVTARRCAPVGGKGSEAKNASASAPSITMPPCSTRSPRILLSAQARTKNSSNINLCRASSRAPKSEGKWMFS